MDKNDWAQVIVALVAVVSAILSGRAARKSTQLTSEASTMNARTQAETESYNRARQMDVQTIERQGKELEEIRANAEKLREKVRELKISNEQLNEDNDRLRRRISRLEAQVGEPSG
jgi:predicted nuclease with TOPRIM domain